MRRGRRRRREERARGRRRPVAGALATLLLPGVLSIACADRDALDNDATTLAEARPRSEWAPLARPEAWTWVSAEDDPFDDVAPSAQVRCGPADARRENGGLELSTTGCDYAALSQALARPLSAGDELHLVLWWQTLASARPATAHLELRIGSQKVWQTEVGIPGPAGVVDVVVPIKQPHASGSRLHFHLHNHGYNTWNLNRVAYQTHRRIRHAATRCG